MEDFQGDVRPRRAPIDHASQLGAISDVTDEEEEKKFVLWKNVHINIIALK